VFRAMERVEGKDLGSSLARAADHQLPPLLAAFVAAECCQALDYAHQRKGPDGVALGIVHRDVTPRNVLLSWSGEVKLTDFGIAALAGDATSRLLGTPQYMAPEQARSEPIDPRADVYAIGLVLREAITGVRPRPGTDRDGMLDAARRGTLMPWPHQAVPASDAELALGSGDHGEPAPPRFSPTLIAIIERATAAVPADRYADARTMLEELDAFIVGERAANKSDSPARQLGAWLAAVWEGARDDVEADAAIDAEHLVSFLDDGAIDVVGTGTMRSLAATAADEAAPPVAAPPAAAPAAASPTLPAAPGADKATVIVSPEAASGPRLAVAPPPGIRLESTARPGRTSSTVSRISSSTTTVASGTFRAVPSGRLGRREGRALGPALRLVAVALAAGAIVFWVMTSLRDRPAAGPAAPGSAAPPPGLSAGGQPGSGQPTGGGEPSGSPPATGSPPAGSPPTGSPPAGSPPTGSPPTGSPPTGSPPTGGQRVPAHPSPGSRTPGPRGASPAGDRGTAGHPLTGPSGKVATSPDAGSAAEAASVAPPARPPTCKVRINLTPWAYYTADDSGERHETPGTIELTPGTHRLHVWNPELHVERDIVLQVPADRDTMNYSEPLQPASLHPGAP